MGDDVSENRGNGGVLDVQRHTTSDIRMINRAIKNRWPVSEAMRQRLVEKLDELVQKDTITVLGDNGPFQAENDRNQIAAARVLVAIEAQTQVDDHLADKNQRMDDGKPTEVVADKIVLTHTAPPASHES